MTYLIFIILTILSVIPKKNRKIVSFFWIYFLVIMGAENDRLADRDNYYNVYNRVGVFQYGNERMEPGFLWLIRMSKRIGLEGYQFYFLIFLVSILLIAFVFIRYVDNYNILFLLYFLFPYGLEAAQIRTLLMDALVIFAFHFLEDKKIKNYILYAVTILLAGSIHNLGYFFIIFLLPVFLKNNRKYNFMVTGVFLVLIYGVYSGEIAGLAGSYATNGTVLEWFQDINSQRWFFLIYVILIFGMVFLINMLIKEMTDNKGLYRGEIEEKNAECRFEKINNILSFSYYINLMMILCIPFLLFSNSFSRMLRTFMIIDYIIFVIYLQSKTKRATGGIKYQKLGKKSIALIFLTVFFLIMIQNTGLTFGSTYIAMFKYNKVF